MSWWRMHAGVVLGAVFAGTVAGSVIMFATQARRQGRGGPAGGLTTSEGEAVVRDSLRPCLLWTLLQELYSLPAQ